MTDDHRYLDDGHYTAPLPPCVELTTQEEMVRRIEAARADERQPTSWRCPVCDCEIGLYIRQRRAPS